jgi:thioredoxin 1
MKILKFGSEWCPTCKLLADRFEELKKEVSDKIIFVDIDGEKESEMVEKYNINNLPTVICLDDNDKEIARFHGIVPKTTLLEVIKAYEE